MHFPIVIQKDPTSDFGIQVPDLPGCFSAGSTIDDCMVMAREAIELHLEGLIEEGQSVPTPQAIDVHRSKSQFRGGTWAIVTVDPSSLRLRARRVNITMPERVLDAADRFAAEIGESRSGLLTRAVSDYLDRHRKARPDAKPSTRKARR